MNGNDDGVRNAVMGGESMGDAVVASRHAWMLS